jgi:hypothetical protein
VQWHGLELDKTWLNPIHASPIPIRLLPLVQLQQPRDGGSVVVSRRQVPLHLRAFVCAVCVCAVTVTGGGRGDCVEQHTQQSTQQFVDGWSRCRYRRRGRLLCSRVPRHGSLMLAQQLVERLATADCGNRCVEGEHFILGGDILAMRATTDSCIESTGNSG